MRTEERTIFLSVLIPFVYGSIFWLETGTFIFPFPLNEFIFAAITAFFAVKHYSRYPLNSIFSAAFAFMNLLSSEFFWSFFVDQVMFAGDHRKRNIGSYSLDELLPFNDLGGYRTCSSGRQNTLSPVPDILHLVQFRIDLSDLSTDDPSPFSTIRCFFQVP